MNDYKVTVTKPWFGGSKTFYTTADSAKGLAQKLDKEFHYEIEMEGVTYTIEKL